jgi:succinoglycan biosynthesis transport protein ExoP
MLHVRDTQVDRGHFDQFAPAVEDEGFDLAAVIAATRRQAWVLAVGVVAGALLGLAYIMTTVPLYTASISILIDKGQSRVVDDLVAQGAVFADEADLLSQVELLKSDQLAEKVVDQLDLTENRAFMSGQVSAIRLVISSVKRGVGFLSSLIAPEPLLDHSDASDVRAAAIQKLKPGLGVRRVGRTYVFELSYTGPDPRLAAQIARAYGEAYLDDQLEAKYDATRRAGSWLQDRIAELREQTFESDLAVQRFRNENGLITTGTRLLSEQQLAELTTQLASVQAQKVEAGARRDQIRALIDSGRTDAVVNDALVSTTINNLRESYLDASKRESEISTKLGPTHIQAVRLRAEMDEYRRLIFEELARIAESYESTYNVMVDREQSLRDSFNEMLGVNAEANTTQVRLRELQREAETFKSLYDSFLQRYQSTVQQQSFPITEARIITPAKVPGTPTYPRKPMVLALFCMLGLACGSGAAAWMEYRERFFRTGDQVRSELRVECLGLAPVITPSDIARGGKGPGSKGPGAQDLWASGTINSYVSAHPMTAFAETLRNVKVAADISLAGNQAKVIGVVSCLPSEGKSTMAASLGTLVAMHSSRVLLIDGDLRNPGLTRGLRERPSRGLVEAVLGDDHAEGDDGLLWSASGRLAVLPTVLKRRIPHTSELLASPAMAALLNRYRSQFDYIFVDLPPISPVVDAKAFANRVDAFVFIVEWGRTSRQLVRTTMANTPLFSEKCLGVILNKVDESKMWRYRSYGSSEYYSSHYTRYYKA